MYAIVDIAGQQFKVEKDQQIFVHSLEAADGTQVEFDQVLLVDDNGKVSVGTPTVDGALVTAKVLSHVKGDKVLVFKKKRRKGYQKLNGHRQQFSEILIEDIRFGAKKKTKAPKQESAPLPEPEVVETPSAPAGETN